MKDQKKILIIDDEPDILEFLSYNFRKNHFSVFTATDGREGLEKIQHEKPELIISDILMPRMDGIEMCNEIKKTDEFREIPLIFLTAVNDDYKVLYAMVSGADQIVSKPVRFKYLLSIVNSLLEAPIAKG